MRLKDTIGFLVSLSRTITSSILPSSRSVGEEGKEQEEKEEEEEQGEVEGDEDGVGIGRQLLLLGSESRASLKEERLLRFSRLR